MADERLMADPGEVDSETHDSLLTEVALAARIIRSSDFPAPLLRWLAVPTQGTKPESQPEIEATRGALEELLAEVIVPLLDSAPSWEKKQARYAPCHLASTLAILHQHSGLAPYGDRERILAAAMLPLYRSLADGDLHTGLEQTRHRLLELIVATEVDFLLDGDLSDLLERARNTEETVHESFANHLEICLIGVSGTMRRNVARCEAEQRTFDSQTARKFRRMQPRDVAEFAKNIPDWSRPAILWDLAGELASEQRDFVLPRSWIDLPVPWQTVAEHWSRIVACLTGNVGIQSTAANSIGSNSVGTNGGDGESEFEKGTASDHSAERNIVLAEVLSHNDPAFVSALQRQLAKARTDATTCSLASIQVEFDGVTSARQMAPVNSGGTLRIWQQRFAHLIRRCEEIESPRLFVTGEGELLLCTRDLERTELSTLLREILEQVVHGQQDSETGAGTLQDSYEPLGTYHVGLASVTLPASSFAPEKLIESTIRCLSATRSQSISTIKSIEVY